MINHIHLSQSDLLNVFDASAPMPHVRPDKTPREILSEVYGEDPITAMRQTNLPAKDDNNVYIWKKADEYAVDYLKGRGYRIEETYIENECIAYTCRRHGESYVVFCFAHGEEKTVWMDAEYCNKLLDLPVAAKRIPLILYLYVKKSVNNEGEIVYKTGSCVDEDEPADIWKVSEAFEKKILLHYPSKEIVDMVFRFIAAYNTLDLDILKSIIAENAVLDSYARCFR